MAKWRADNANKKRQYDADYREANKERLRTISAAWRIANRERRREIEEDRRARKRSTGRLSRGLVKRLFSLQLGKCVCCGKTLGKNYHIDHIVPLARGGAHRDDNIQLLTQRCNNQKKAMDPVDFMQSRGFLI